MIWNVHNVNGAQQDLCQIQLERPVLSNQDQQSMLEVSQPVLNIKSSILIEVNVFHAQINL